MLKSERSQNTPVVPLVSTVPAQERCTQIRIIQIQIIHSTAKQPCSDWINLGIQFRLKGEAEKAKTNYKKTKNKKTRQKNTGPEMSILLAVAAPNNPLNSIKSIKSIKLLGTLHQ